MSNAMRLGKRTLAGVAAGALAVGMLSIAAAPVASAGKSIKPKATNSIASSTVTPVRVTLTGSALDTVPYAKISWTASGTLTSSSTAIVTLTTAPSATAQLGVVTSALVGSAAVSSSNSFSGLATDTAILGQPTDVGGGITVGTGSTGAIGIAANQAGTYSGTITVQPVAGDVDVVPFTFTSRGAPTSMTLTPANATAAVSGTATFTTTLLDSAGNATQPETVDSVTLAATSGSLSAITATGSGGSSLYDGVATSTYEAPGTAGTYTVTATPAGTLTSKGVTTQTASVTVSGSVSTAPVTSISVDSPGSVASGTNPTAAQAAIPSNTSTVVVAVEGTASTTVRFAAYSTAQTGTINGSTAGIGFANATVFTNVALDATGAGTATFTLGGNLTAVGSAIKLDQVTAAGALVGSGGVITITQTQPEVSVGTIIPSPRGSIIQAIGTSTPVSVLVTDQFEQPVANAVVRAYRTSISGTLLSSGTTNSSGIASVTVSNASGITSGTVESYVFTAQPPAGAAIGPATLGLSVTYTTSGAVTSMSVTSSVGTSPILNTTTSIAVQPFIVVPYDGFVNTAATGTYTVATEAGTAAGEYVTFAATPSPANQTTVSVPTGVKVSTTAPSATTLWSAGSQSVTASSGQNIYVWATATGTHDITFTSGSITTTAKIRVANQPASAYNIAISPTSTTVNTGAFGTAVVTVTDVFGNPVPGATGAATGGTRATASGAILLGGQASSQDLTTGSAGTATITLIASSSAGAGLVSIAPATSSTTPAWVTGYTPPTGAAAPVKAASLAVTVSAAPVPVATTITWGTVPASVNAGSITMLEGTLKDQNGVVMDNADVNIVITGSATIGTSGIKTGQVETNAEGKFFVGALAGASGTFTVKATADTNALATATTSSVTVTAAPTPATITVLPAGGGVVPTSVEAGSSVQMVATVKDTAGAAEANEAVEVAITGNATFANGNTQYVANTGASGTLGFTVIAGASGTFTVTATVVSAPAVKASAGPITITAAPVKVITITGSRGEGADPVPAGQTCRSIAGASDRCVKVDGTATNFAAGSLMTPEYRFPGQTSYEPGQPVSVADQKFNWFRKTGKKIYVKFTSGGLMSNTVIIDAR